MFLFFVGFFVGKDFYVVVCILVVVVIGVVGGIVELSWVDCGEFVCFVLKCVG